MMKLSEEQIERVLRAAESERGVNYYDSENCVAFHALGRRPDGVRTSMDPEWWGISKQAAGEFLPKEVRIGMPNRATSREAAMYWLKLVELA